MKSGMCSAICAAANRLIPETETKFAAFFYRSSAFASARLLLGQLELSSWCGGISLGEK